MKRRHFALLALALTCIVPVAMAAEKPAFDPELAKKLGADERGMKMYVLCILKTGPKDAEIKGEERNKIFAGHFANIGRLADEGKLAVAGPFGDNTKSCGAGTEDNGSGTCVVTPAPPTCTDGTASTSSTSRPSRKRRSSSSSIPPSKLVSSSLT